MLVGKPFTTTVVNKMLNEHVPYKRGVIRPKWCSQKLLDTHQNMAVRMTTKKQPKSRILKLVLAQNSCYIQSTYTKVDTVAQESTCDSCFRQAIADTKKSDEYRLLQPKKTPEGI